MFNTPWLLDTNILLRFFPFASTNYPEVESAVNLLLLEKTPLSYTSQNLSEFWNVCTHPTSVNGLGLTVTETNRVVLRVEDSCTLAPDGEAAHMLWRKLIVDHQVSGIQVHDARIVATMRVNSIANLLTLNVRDFRRYDGIVAMTPQELLRSA